MHSQFAKLFLGHHVFRGLKGEPIPIHFLVAAATAYETATNIFTIVLGSNAFRENLLGMPQCFHIMMSFAGHFLLEVCAKYREQLGMNLEVDLERIRAVLAHFARIKAHPQHSITRMTTGLINQLSRFAATMGIESGLTGSPFMSLDFLNSTGLNMANLTTENQTTATMGLNLQTTSDSSGMPLFSDFPNFAFQDINFDFYS